MLAGFDRDRVVGVHTNSDPLAVMGALDYLPEGAARLAMEQAGYTGKVQATIRATDALGNSYEQSRIVGTRLGREGQ